MPKRAQPMYACGLDFGTSNSGVALARRRLGAPGAARGRSPRRSRARSSSRPRRRRRSYGRAAVREYLDGTPGRLMRSLKSLLGSSLMRRNDGDRRPQHRVHRRRSRSTCGCCASAPSATRGTALDAVVLGRPVRFVDDDAVRDADAQATLAVVRARRRLSPRRVPARADRGGLRLRTHDRRAKKPCWSSTSAAAPPTSR